MQAVSTLARGAEADTQRRPPILALHGLVRNATSIVVMLLILLIPAATFAAFVFILAELQRRAEERERCGLCRGVVVAHQACGPGSGDDEEDDRDNRPG